jgi:DnaJ-class molecular chaperone
MEFKDYYAALGVTKTSTDKEIKQAYRKLARKYHPDVNPGDRAAEARFKELTEAYEVLGDPEKRRKYDELGANWKYYEQAQRQGPSQGVPFEDFLRNMGGGGASYRTMTEEEAQNLFGGADPFSDFFKQFFGGASSVNFRRGRTKRGARPRKGDDLEQQVELSLEEAFSGVTRRLSVRQNGHAKTIDVRIPAGVKDGSRVRIAGEGAPGPSGTPHGDLFLKVRLRPHAVFAREGADLHVRLAVPLTTVVLGGAVDVPSPAGKPLRLKIPPLTQNGQRFRLRDQGMPVPGKPGERGSMFVTVDVLVPRTLSDEQRQHFEALARIDRGA